MGIVQWFHDLGSQEGWVKHKFDPTLCSYENASNFVESFNSTLRDDVCKPVLTLLGGNFNSWFFIFYIFVIDV